MFTAENYVRASSLDEAYELNQNRKNRIVGGMHWLKQSSSSLDTLIDLSGLELNEIIETEDSFIIGSMCTLRDLELSECLNKYTDYSIRKAVRHIVGVQFRNTATVGGSIYGRYGFSDVLTVLMALDTHVELYKGGLIPLSEYAQLRPDRDIVVNVIVRKSACRESFQCVRNTKTDFSVLNLAVSRNADGKFRIVVGARPHKAVIIEDNAEIIPVDPENIKAFAEKIASTVCLGDNLRGSKEYRRHLVNVLCARAVEEINHADNA